jgi:hypothetical protein
MEIRVPRLQSAVRTALSGLLTAALLAACGGGDDAPAPAASCTLDDQKSWLGSYMSDQYLWYATKPNPDPAPFTSITDYFQALLTRGVAGNPDLPFDRWSFSESTAAFNQFFGAGQTMGYGLFVAGNEVSGTSNPLRVRYLEPASPAAMAGIRRGETIVSINGVPAATYTQGGDFALLTPIAEGETLQLVMRDAGGAERPVSLTAATYTLTPLADGRIISSPAGKAIGYVLVKDFISQALSPMDAAFANFKANGVTEVVLDLRYNGGGLVSTADALASYVAGDAVSGRTFALLTHSDKQQAQNTRFTFNAPPAAMAASRVFVLTGSRTCSASELVVNGLAPFTQVVQIGETTCGKPVGFVPVERCGTTYNAVNFESRNDAGTGRYWNGLAPAGNCVLSDDLDHALGDPDEALLSAARSYVDAGACPATALHDRPQRLRRDAPRRSVEGERPGVTIGR